ncbi:MAG TPA: hypothetical protein PKE40_11860 [Arachnia sp.]|nr:hypothetical protein [Arachnia sp.]HMT87040.1 hypothetical protein [Arachnia sp.]
MTHTPRIDLRLVGGLACLALLYPILGVILDAFGAASALTAPIDTWLWLGVGVAWTLIVWLTRAPSPVLTLVITGAAGGVLTVLAVGIIQVVYSGSASLLTAPAGIAALVVLNTLGGLVCGLIAWGLQAFTHRPKA